MANIVQHKRSDVSGNIPPPTIMEYGELAINYHKGEESIYFKNDNDEIVGLTAGVTEQRVYDIVSDAMLGNVEIGGVTLYDYETGNFSAVTLSDNVSNYQSLEIFAKTDDGVCLYQKVFNPQNKKVGFVSVSMDGTTTIVHKYKVYDIVNNTLSTNTNNGTLNAGNNSLRTGNNKNDVEISETYIGIYKVIGWK